MCHCESLYGGYGPDRKAIGAIMQFEITSRGAISVQDPMKARGQDGCIVISGIVAERMLYRFQKRGTTTRLIYDAI